ncbi:hypothetical protein LJC20_07360 [Eubacteriales bacterium OttesenSCG-928-M02]|nr:hypothetical protein [Eubacteriales bacterium OttesenSCG-928-M02]
MDLIAQRRWIEWRDKKIPVMDLAYEIGAYRKMGRMERARELEMFLKEASGNNSR